MLAAPTTTTSSRPAARRKTCVDALRLPLLIRSPAARVARLLIAAWRSARPGPRPHNATNSFERERAGSCETLEDAMKSWAAVVGAALAAWTVSAAGRQIPGPAQTPQPVFRSGVDI